MAKGVKVAGKKVVLKVAGEGEETQIASGNDKNDEHDEAAAEEKRRRQLIRPGGCRSYLRNELAKHFPKIVDGFVEEAKKGGCNHLKQSIEFLKPVRNGAPRRKGPADRLLAELLED
jgi:hypothetical protein